MKPIPLRIHRINMFVPVVNILGWVIVDYNQRCLQLPKWELAKADLLAFTSMISILTVSHILCKELPSVNALFSILGFYPSPIVMNFVLINALERLGVT